MPSSHMAAPSGLVAETQRTEIQLRILRAAVHLFATQGYHATSIKDLARQAKMTASNLYNYYPSKEEILFDVYVTQLSRQLASQSEIAGSTTDAVERIRAFAYAIVYADLADPLAGFIAQPSGLKGKRARVVRDMMREVREQWIETIAAGIADESFAPIDPRLAALNAITMCSYTGTWFDPRGELSKVEVAEQTAECCLRMLRGFPGKD